MRPTIRRRARIAKRRAGATLISYLTPPIANAGLYRGLIDLKVSLDRWRKSTPDDLTEREELATIIQAQAAELDLATLEPAWGHEAELTYNRSSFSQFWNWNIH